MQLSVPWLPDGRLGLIDVKRIHITSNLKESNHFLLLCCSINNAHSLLIGTTYHPWDSEEVLWTWGLKNWTPSISSGLKKGPDTMVEILQQLAVSRKTTAWNNVFKNFRKVMHPNLPSLHLHNFLHDKDKGKHQMWSKTASRRKLERNFIPLNNFHWMWCISVAQTKVK